MGYPLDASRFEFPRGGVRLYTRAPLVVNLHAFSVVAARFALSYQLPLDDLCGIICRKQPIRDCLGKISNGFRVFVANAGGITTEGMFFRVKRLSIWHNWEEIVAVVLHGCPFLDTWGSHMRKWQQRTQ